VTIADGRLTEAQTKALADDLIARW